MQELPEKLTTREKLAYGMGNLPGAFFLAFIGQIQAFYYAWMGLHVAYILVAQVFYAIWNVINDPIFGLLQDRTRTKMGRYLPWIKWCSPIFTIDLKTLLLWDFVFMAVGFVIAFWGGTPPPYPVRCLL